jgi:L-alanine-DL-glutamate epimerase-like enolase superfamily enzyme
MTDAPRLRIREVQRFEWPFKLRLPFRFGVITVTEGRQAVLRARIALEDGREGWGVAAESLAAKWFDKDPRRSDAENVDQLRRALELAEGLYLAAGPLTAFGHFAESYQAQLAAAAAEGLNPLVAGFGPALLDRAVLDALCRIEGISVYDAMLANRVGLAPHAIAPDLDHVEFDRLCGSLVPDDAMDFRHTVGLLDPITAADVRPGEKVDDGLPQTLEQVVTAYRPRYFKLKVSGKLDADLDRLIAIARVLDRGGAEYVVTLDGNEQFHDPAEVLAFWEALEAKPALEHLCAGTYFIEQPIARAEALARDIRALASEVPVIIDESDGTLDTFPRAVALGYEGVSSKACKGVYKSILNLTRCRLLNALENRPRYVMTGEDLTTLAGVSVQQDLALAALLGIKHAERNGHHYVDGFAGRPVAEARRFLAAHPGLYRESHGRVRLQIDDGSLDLSSLACVGFATAATPDFKAMEEMPKSKWRAS